MKTINLVFLLLFASLAFGQNQEYDLIKTIRNFEVKSFVQEISDEVVKYKRFDNPDGPNFVLKLKDVQYIIYKNGTRDDFNKPLFVPTTQSIVTKPQVATKPIDTVAVKSNEIVSTITETTKTDTVKVQEIMPTIPEPEPVKIVPAAVLRREGKYKSSPYVSTFKGEFYPPKLNVYAPLTNPDGSPMYSPGLKKEILAPR